MASLLQKQVQKYFSFQKLPIVQICQINDFAINISCFQKFVGICSNLRKAPLNNPSLVWTFLLFENWPGDLQGFMKNLGNCDIRFFSKIVKFDMLQKAPLENFQSLGLAMANLFCHGYYFKHLFIICPRIFFSKFFISVQRRKLCYYQG